MTTTSLGNKLFRCQIKSLNLKEFDFGVQANSLALDIDSEATDNLPNHLDIYINEVNRSLARAFFEDKNFAVVQLKKVRSEQLEDFVAYPDRSCIRGQTV